MFQSRLGFSPRCDMAELAGVDDTDDITWEAL
jgi:hypothetical protein